MAVTPPPEDHPLAKRKIEVAVERTRAREIFSSLQKIRPNFYSDYNIPQTHTGGERVCEMCGKVYAHHHLQAANLCGTVHVKGSCSYKAKLLRKIMRYRARQGIEGIPSDYKYKPRKGGWKWGKRT